MIHLARLTLVLGLAGLVQACQLAAPGGVGGGAGVTANAVTGDAIEVTALDAPPAGAAAPPPVALAAAGAQAAPPPAGEKPEDGVPAPIPESTTATATGQDVAAEAPALAAAPAPADAVPVVVPDPKSDKQLACEGKKGQWVRVGTLKACVFPTRDSGKRCDRESQCDGVCLARSGTCSPVKPLYGCNEVFQDNGARVTECLE